MKELVIANT